MRILKLSQDNFEETIKISLTTLKKGKVLVCPTDTVYGLLSDAENKDSVEKIFEIKRRDKSKPLAVFVKDIKTAKKLAFIDKSQEKFLRNNKITVILEAKDKKLSPLVYKNNTIGLRIPDYKPLNLILNKFRKPLAQTSANISGNGSFFEIKEVLKEFDGEKMKPDLVIDAGDLLNNKPSTIIDLTEKVKKIIRF